MKKNYITFMRFSKMFAIFCAFVVLMLSFETAVHAQTVTIGTGTSTARYPLNDYYVYSRSQCLYLSTEIGTGGTITKLRWYRSDTGADANAISTTKIWLMETSNTTLTGTAWEGPGTLVASISNIDLGSGGGWYEIDITDFVYSGTQNLLVSVRTQDAPSVIPHSSWRYTSTTSNYRARLGNSDSSNPPTMSLNYSRPNLQMDIVVGPPPTCIAPTGLSSTNVLTNSAKINWTASTSSPTSGYDIYYSTSNTAPVAGTTPSVFVVAGTTTANLSSLAANTKYYFWVRSNCDGTDKSTWAGSSTFTTPCAPISTFPWTENFEGVVIPAFPNCWFKENGDWVTTNNDNSTYDADARSGVQFLRESYTATNEYMWTPGFQLTAGLSYDFSFWWAGDNNSGWIGDVFYNTSQVSAGATQIGASFVQSTATTTENYDQVKKTFIAPTTGTYYFAIRVNALSDPWYLSFDDFRMEPTPSCIVPTALTSSAITASSATISWTASTSSPTNGYDIYYNTTNTAPTGVSLPSASVGAGVTTYNMSGLSPSTQYYVWVRSNCGSGDLSTWAGSTTFTTPCANSPLTLTEGFNTTGTSIFPDCWTQQQVTGTSNLTFATSGTYPTVSPQEGTRMVYWNSLALC